MNGTHALQTLRTLRPAMISTVLSALTPMSLQMVFPAGAAAQTAKFTYAERAVGGFQAPGGVALDANGDLYVATNSGSIEELMAVNGQIPANPTIKTIATGIPSPENIAVDSSGNV